MEVFNNVKSGYGVFLRARGAVRFARHPLLWVKRQLITAVRSALIAGLTKRIGGPAARAVVQRLDLEGKTYPFSFDVPLHLKIRGAVSNPEHVAFVQKVLNDVLAIPLELLGYRLVQVSFTCSEGAEKLVVRAELGLTRLDSSVPLQPTFVEEVPVQTVGTRRSVPALFAPPKR